MMPKDKIIERPTPNNDAQKQSDQLKKEFRMQILELQPKFRRILT